MRDPWWSRLPILLVAAALCCAGGWRVYAAPGELTGAALMAAGLITLGFWLAKNDD